MYRVRRSSESGVVLLNIIGILIIMLTVLGLLFSTQPLEVNTLKLARARKEVELIATAVEQFSQDALKMNYFNIPQNKINYLTVLPPPIDPAISVTNLDLAVLVDSSGIAPSRGFVDPNFWKGPYLSVDQNTSLTLGMEFSSDKRPLDPWGNPYVCEKDPNSPLIFEIKSTSHSGVEISNKKNLTEFALKETEDRRKIVNLAIENYNEFKVSSGSAPTMWSAWGFGPTVYTGSGPYAECTDGLDVYEKMTAAGYLPSDPRLNADALGVPWDGYSDIDHTLFDDDMFAGFAPDFNQMVVGPRKKFIPTNVAVRAESPLVNSSNAVPPGMDE